MDILFLIGYLSLVKSVMLLNLFISCFHVNLPDLFCLYSS